MFIYVIFINPFNKRQRHYLMYLYRENLKFKCVCGYGQLDIFDRKFACTKYCFTNGISRRFVTTTKKSNYFSCLHKKSSYDNVQILHQMWFQNLNKAHQICQKFMNKDVYHLNSHLLLKIQICSKQNCLMNTMRQKVQMNVIEKTFN